MSYPFPKSVKEAALILDVEIPGWYNRVDLNTLYMPHCKNCIIGQVFGNSRFTEHLTSLFGPMGSWNWRKLGFSGFNPHPFAGNQNPAEWVAAIIERRNAEVPVLLEVINERQSL